MQHSPVLKIRMDRLNELCKANGIETTRELAKRVGVDQSTFWRIENNIQNPSSSLIAKVKAAFPLASLDYLIEVV